MMDKACGLILLNMCYNNTILTQTTFTYEKMHVINGHNSWMSAILSNKVRADCPSQAVIAMKKDPKHQKTCLSF